MHLDGLYKGDKGLSSKFSLKYNRKQLIIQFKYKPSP